jgi:hypothetical protein
MALNNDDDSFLSCCANGSEACNESSSVGSRSSRVLSTSDTTEVLRSSRGTGVKNIGLSESLAARSGAINVEILGIRDVRGNARGICLMSEVDALSVNTLLSSLFTPKRILLFISRRFSNTCEEV